MKLLGAIIGALLGIGFAEYHNSHVSVWTGGYTFNAVGFGMLAIVGAFVGVFIGWAINRVR